MLAESAPIWKPRPRVLRTVCRRGLLRQAHLPRAPARRLRRNANSWIGLTKDQRPARPRSRQRRPRRTFNSLRTAQTPLSIIGLRPVRPSPRLRPQFHPLLLHPARKRAALPRRRSQHRAWPQQRRRPPHRPRSPRSALSPPQRSSRRQQTARPSRRTPHPAFVPTRWREHESLRVSRSTGIGRPPRSLRVPRLVRPVGRRG